MSAILDELKQIQDANGGILLPEKVVEFAADETTELHSRFTWDDTEAAKKYRIAQARALIRVHVTMIDAGEGRKENVRAFVHLSSDAKGYRNIEAVLEEPDLHRQMLEDALAELNRLRVKFQRLRELDPVFSAAEKIAEQVVESRQEAAAA